jgi:Zn-dependent M28 family amino/carboxypeptidase
MTCRAFRLAAFLGAVSAVVPAAAQQSPFLPPEVHRALVNEISGDIAFEHIRWFTHYHRPMGGADGFEAVARYVEQKAREYGLEDVRRIDLASDGPSWSPRVGELWLVTPDERRLAYSREIPLALADLSRPATIDKADLIDVGNGVAEADYAGKDVAGTVVLASGPLGRVMDEAVWKRGALGIVAFSDTRMPDHPDQYPWMRIPSANADKTKPGTFAFVLTNREGTRLRKQLAAAGGRGFAVRARVESVFHEPASQAIVEAVIRGTSIHDQDLVLTGHLQEEMFSANDDASGCANVLEIARALKKSIDEGRLPRPARDIRFWWVDEISAPEQYFADHPEERAQFLANVNQDMVGARQSAGSRVQFVTRPPFSRASFLGDVVESIVVSLVEGNTSYLAAGQARGLVPGRAAADEGIYTRPVLSRLGTTERYDARVVPFHNNTDHQVFNMGIVGIPGVTFTNWPDEFIHSSDDDLWQMDATQLERNAVAVAATAYYLANAGEAQVPVLASHMYGRALERMSRDATTAMTMVATAAPAARAEAYARAANLVREAARRERRALESVRRLGPAEGPGRKVVDRFLVQLPTDVMAEARLAGFFTGLTGSPDVPRVAIAPERAATASRVPRAVDDVKGFLAKRDKITRPAGLHPLMFYEVLNFVDGTRTYFDIYGAVAAEADHAGEWYYGAVRYEDVAAALDSAVEAGVLTLGTAAARP